MSQVAVIGCGIIGATIAYELSKIPDLNVTLIDQNQPAQGSTGAALGVLMGVISHKVKGRGWQLRSQTLKRYETLIPELETVTGRSILYNRLGLLMLCSADDNLTHWQELINIRQQQGYSLEYLNLDDLQSQYPQVNCEGLIGAIYSPQDRQVDPTALTLALVEAAEKNGVKTQFGVTVQALNSNQRRENNSICRTLKTTAGILPVDWVVMAAGLGTTPLLTNQYDQKPIKIRPVLGQALRLQLNQPLGQIQPVITGNDFHIVPLENDQYWIGATVEFPEHDNNIVVNPSLLDDVLAKAIAICPGLSQGKILQQWSGLRPRPDGQPAPIIQPLSGYDNVLLATGHYRNGVLLAPVTAAEICQMIVNRKTS